MSERSWSKTVAAGAWVSYAAPVRIDLHRHLEGSHSAAALAAVAAAFDVRDPLYFDAALGRHKTAAELAPQLALGAPSDDATLFYACITRARAAYVSEAAIAALARAAFAEAADDTDGLEMRVSLFSMTRTLLDNTGVAWRDLAPVAFAERARALLLGVLAARDAVVVEKRKPIVVRVGFSRTFESAPHYAAMAEVLREHKAALCGLDVLGIVATGDREPMPAALRTILLSLRKDIADLTVHAGEFEGADSVERTLELAPEGIGHGVRSVESDATMARLRDQGVTLEVCPSSNRLLIPSTLRALEAQRGATPLLALQRAHVHCVLGSDDPTPMSTSYTHEEQVAQRLGVDMERLRADTARRWAQLPQPR